MPRDSESHLVAKSCPTELRTERKVFRKRSFVPVDVDKYRGTVLALLSPGQTESQVDSS